MSEEFIVEGEGARKARLARENAEKLNESMKVNREGLPEHVIVMVIAYDTKEGQVQVQGPIGNKFMSYGMLEMAKDCIRQYNQDNIPGVIKP